MHRVLVPLIAMSMLAGCAGRIDRFLVRGAISEALATPDVGMACASANASTAIAGSLSDKDKTWRSEVILNTTAAACAQLDAMEAELTAERALYSLDGQAQLIAVKDARAAQRRAHTTAARRQWRAYTLLEQVHGTLGEGCPDLKRDEDRLAWFIGTLAGGLALLEDQSGGGEIGVPMSVLPQVSRAAACLDDEDWWSVPSALEASMWALIPGKAPEGVDPFEALAEAADRGETQGMHLARSIQIRIAAVAGRDDQVEVGLKAFNDQTRSPPAAFVVLEDYARRLALHQADLVWTRARGYRAPALGQLPQDDTGPPPGSGADPFAGDPFAEDGADPFAEPEDDGTDAADTPPDGEAEPAPETP